jgi:hypothetical protein
VAHANRRLLKDIENSYGYETDPGTHDFIAHAYKAEVGT